ncbi:MAG: erythromycin esterase family protein, partial [Steroidobacteraceae bacterium]
MLLGEQTHGHGTTFLAKTRLIKFLHQRMGFDVLAFESGLYDCAKAWDYMLAGEAPDQAFRRGVFGVWNGSEQIQPLIRYLGASARAARPLELAGFDSQLTATASRDFLLSDLEKFLQSHGIAAAKVQGWADLGTLLNAQTSSGAPSAERLRSASAALDELRARVTALPGDPARYGSVFWAQMLESLTAQTAGQEAVLKALQESTTAQGNRGLQALGNKASYLRSWRDVQMGKNFLWLARQRYPARKIIVWAATYHTMRNAETIVNPAQPNEYKYFLTMGQVIWEAMGEETYNIGFVASEGSAGWWRHAPQ